MKKTMYINLIFGREFNYCLPKDPPPYGLIDYADSNFAGDPEDQKLVMDYCFFLNRAVVFWRSKKQRTISISITEAKYIALRHVAREAVWIR